MIHKFVRSKYRSKWYGVVIDILKRKTAKDLYLILVLKDKNGDRIKGQLFKILDEAWTEDIEPFDITGYNKMWFEITSTQEWERTKNIIKSKNE